MNIKIILIDYIGRVSSRSMSMMAEKSKSVPFLDAPKNLNGLVGDKGYSHIYIITNLLITFITFIIFINFFL